MHRIVWTGRVVAVRKTVVEVGEVVGDQDFGISLPVGPCLRRDDREKSRDDREKSRDDREKSRDDFLGVGMTN